MPDSPCCQINRGRTNRIPLYFQINSESPQSMKINTETNCLYSILLSLEGSPIGPLPMMISRTERDFLIYYYYFFISYVLNAE